MLQEISQISCHSITRLLSGWHIFTVLFGCRCRAKYRHLYELAGTHLDCYYSADRMWGWRSCFQFDWFIFLFTPFLWIICSKRHVPRLKFCMLNKLCVTFEFFSQWSPQRKRSATCVREGRQGWGGGFGGATQRWLVPRNAQSLQRGRHCSLEKGSVLHWGVWASLTLRICKNYSTEKEEET